MKVWLLWRDSRNYDSGDVDVVSIHESEEEANAEMARIDRVFGEPDDSYYVADMTVGEKVSPEVVDRPWEEFVWAWPSLIADTEPTLSFKGNVINKGDHWFKQSDRSNDSIVWLRIGDGPAFKVNRNTQSGHQYLTKLDFPSVGVDIWNDPNQQKIWEDSRRKMRESMLSLHDRLNPEKTEYDDEV